MWLAIHPNEKEKPEYYDSILNGVEIFKINASDGNLAGRNHVPNPRVISTTPSKVQRVRGQSKNMLYVVLVVLLGLIVGSVIVVAYKFKRKELATDVTEYMTQKLGIEEDKFQELCLELYKIYGTTMAGLKAVGCDFDYDDFHQYSKINHLEISLILRNLRHKQLHCEP
ncbi:putative receptor-like protein kinase [Raphanus sativus]|nr:putative receptor-like protein kinase [Raphanus sativus]